MTLVPENGFLAVETECILFMTNLRTAEQQSNGKYNL